MKTYNPARDKQIKQLKSILFQVFAVLVGLVIIFPIIYALFISVMPADQILSTPPKILPRSITGIIIRKLLKLQI